MPAPDPHTRRLEDAFRAALGTKVALTRGRRGGRLVISFYSDEELQAIYEHIVGEPADKFVVSAASAQSSVGHALHERLHRRQEGSHAPLRRPALYRRRVYTADPAQPWAEAVAVRDGRILAVGEPDALAELRGPRTEVVALGDRLLLPGFTESHIHFVETALRAAEVDATGLTTPEQVAAAVRERMASAPPGAWVRGGGWDASLWTDGARAHRALLDAVAGDTPVALDSKDLHSVWVNSAALRRAGITASTADVPGGVIERDADGAPTGILRENAVSLLAAAIPEPTRRKSCAAMTAIIPALWATGIVAVHNANDSADGRSLRAYQSLRDAGELGVRVLQHIPAPNLSHALALGLRSGLGDAWLRIGGVKLFADGALGSRTASML